MDLADLRHRAVVFHRRVLYWGAVAALAVLTALVVGGAVRRAEAARAAWGEALATVVAAADLPTGHVLSPADVRVENWPRAVRPMAAMSAVPVGAVLSRPVFAGEALVGERLGPAGVGPVAAALPAGHRGVTLPRGEVMSPLQPGDRVELRAVTVDELGLPVTESVGDGEVILLDEDGITVAVPADSVSAVVEGLVTGQVVPVVLPAAAP